MTGEHAQQLSAVGIQATMLPLLPPPRMRLPLVENATESTMSDSVASLRISWPVTAFQTKTALPLPAAAIRLPSGDTATDSSGPVWSVSVANSCQVAVS